MQGSPRVLIYGACSEAYARDLTSLFLCWYAMHDHFSNGPPARNEALDNDVLRTGFLDPIIVHTSKWQL